MKDYLKRILILAAIVVFYFIVWKEVRSAFTQYVIIPQVEVASQQCNTKIQYEIASQTAILIHREQSPYRLNAPAGFYLLFGLAFTALCKGGWKFYRLFLGYHLVFSAAVVLTLYVGLCHIPLFLHLSSAGNAYFTPFFTFFVIILLLFPSSFDQFKKIGQ